MLQKTICMTGAKAASFFYDEQNFIRKGGMPEPILATLLGKGGVQGLDGTAHRHRKKMFMSVMTSENIERLVKLTEKIWMENLPGWMQQEKIHLYDEFLQILTRAVCSWVGIPLDSREVKNKTELLRAMFDDAGSA
jgi:fatty-acid peroxygenase